MSDVPSATVVQDGKLGGDVPKGGASGGKRPVYKRRLSNYLLDKRLQLRYVLLVTILSGVISGSLGYLIYQQRHAASESIERDLAALTQDDKSLKGFQEQVAAGMAAEDRELIYKMIGVGIGLVVVLSFYLLIMTHKVAGPLYKVSGYFDKMAEGKLGNVWGLRKGDMLQDFFASFKEMHDATRARMQADLATMEASSAALRANGDEKLLAALEAMDKHLAQRKQQLS